MRENKATLLHSRLLNQPLLFQLHHWEQDRKFQYNQFLRPTHWLLQDKSLCKNRQFWKKRRKNRNHLKTKSRSRTKTRRKKCHWKCLLWRKTRLRTSKTKRFGRKNTKRWKKRSPIMWMMTKSRRKRKKRKRNQRKLEKAQKTINNGINEWQSYPIRYNFKKSRVINDFRIYNTRTYLLLVHSMKNN